MTDSDESYSVIVPYPEFVTKMDKARTKATLGL